MKLIDGRGRKLTVGQRVRIEENIPSENGMLYKDSIVKLDEIKLEFDNASKLSVAKKAKALGTNARGLKNILDRVLLPFQFDAHEMKNKGVTTIKITGDVIDKNADPVLLFKKQDGISKKQSV